MKPLYKVFNESSSTVFSDVHKQRIHHENTQVLEMTVKPLNHAHAYSMYYLPTTKMILEVGKIYTLNQQLLKTFESLPGIAQKCYITDCLVEEMEHTNEIEGVKSSREELARSVRDLNRGSKRKRRFSSMVNAYSKLFSDELQLPTVAESVRMIYDAVVLEEMEASNVPDGELFRKDATYVLKKSGSGKEIHRGVMPESKIKEYITQMIAFLQSDTHPELLKIAIAHYYFGYIHPFYDGNGRTSRFISSLYLNEALSLIAAISLSRGCHTI